MSKINLSPSQFGDFTVAFLLDKIIHPDEIIPGNEEFSKFIKDMKGKGAKSLMIQYYLTMDPNIRLYYKRVKSTFEGNRNNNSVIYLMPRKEKEKKKKKKEGIIKRSIKKLLRKESITKDERDLLLEYIEEEKE